MKRTSIVIWTILLFSSTIWAQQVPVQEYVLSERPQASDGSEERAIPTWPPAGLRKVGSVNERPGITGLFASLRAHDVQGDARDRHQDIKKDLELMAQMDSVKAEIRKEEQAQIQPAEAG